LDRLEPELKSAARSSASRSLLPGERLRSLDSSSGSLVPFSPLGAGAFFGPLIANDSFSIFSLRFVSASAPCTTMRRMVHMAAIDWSAVTALATVALVLAASAAALYAKRDIEAHLRTSADDLRATREATQAAQEAAQRQLQASYRPLLIETPPHGPPDESDRALVAGPNKGRVQLRFPGGHEDFADPRAVYVELSGPRINVAVPLRNVGNGRPSSTPCRCSSSASGCSSSASGNS
jgi:hypothetical protein